ncbi:MAG: quinol:cytochrome C oxidoreductase [Cytophagales bacterium]|nr:quinol:cytochrome C oxidoreductase [Cytophagales bacterium]
MEYFQHLPQARKKILITLLVGSLFILLDIFRPHTQHPPEKTSDKSINAAERYLPLQENPPKDKNNSTDPIHNPNKEEKHEAKHDGHESAPTWLIRLLSSLWHHSVFFIGIALCGVAFAAIQFVSAAKWSAYLHRIPENFGSWIYIGGLSLIGLFFIAQHDIFHWTHTDLYDPASPHYDPIIAGKKAYLNPIFYILRTSVFVLIWHVLFHKIQKYSTRKPDPFDRKRWRKVVCMSVIFLIFFALSSSVAAWDWVMSIDTHWFSTMFGWYSFASWWVASLALLSLIICSLKKKGYLPHLNDSHLHDLAKYVFAFSIFWTYIWLSQFLLIYYANIPEESIYFVERIRSQPYQNLFWICVCTNFFVPFLLLMTRNAKRNYLFLQISCGIVFLGHWLDFYLLITPGVLKKYGQIGWMEIGVLLVFLALFLWVFLHRLSRFPLTPKSHPFLKESIQHHT